VIFPHGQLCGADRLTNATSRPAVMGRQQSFMNMVTYEFAHTLKKFNVIRQQSFMNMVTYEFAHTLKKFNVIHYVIFCRGINAVDKLPIRVGSGYAPRVGGEVGICVFFLF